MNKTKILFLIPSLKIAGAEKVCCNICDNLDFDKFDVNLISLSNDVPLFKTLKNKEKIKLFKCDYPDNIKFPWISVKSLVIFFKIIRDIKPEIVHSHLWGINSLFLYLFFFTKKPKFVATIHSSEFIYTSKKLSSKLFKQVENIAYRIFKFQLIAISETVERMISQNLFSKKIVRIENGIDTQVFTPEQRGNYLHYKKMHYSGFYPILVHVGRSSNEKRQIDLIHATFLLKKKFPNIKLLLVGRGNKDALSDVSKQLQILENVDFIETTNEVVKYLSIADIGVFPSLYEGLSLALAEMMSCELPLIISDIPVLTEMTNNEEAALTVPIKSPAAIVEKVIFLVKNIEIAENIGDNARKIAVEKYSIDKMVDKHNELYESLIEL